MEGHKRTPANELSGASASSASKPSAPRSWDEGRVSTASELIESLNQIPVNQALPEARRELTTSELLELFGNPRPDSRYQNARTMTAVGNSQGSPNKSQTMHNKDRNHDYQSVAIDQCDITSSVDYGSRDYYPLSTHTSGSPYFHKENELDELYKSCTDTRGNWWEGSLYY